MKYKVVGLFDNDSDSYIKNVKSKLTKKFKLNRGNLNIYIHLGTIPNGNFKTMDSVISHVLEPYKKFKIELDKNIHIDRQNKLINLQAENKGYVTRISRNIMETLSLYGVCASNNDFYEKLYIPLVNISQNKVNYYLKHNNFFVLNSYIPSNLKMTKLELWKVPNNHRSIVVKSYPLKDY